MQSISANPPLPGLTPTQMQTIQSFYDGLKDEVGLDQGLSPREVRRLMRLSRENLFFVDDSIDAIEQLPEMCPRYLNPDQAIAEAKLYHQVRYLEQLHQQIGRALHDQLLSMGNKCYQNGILIYRSTKTAAKAGYPGAAPIYKQLKKRFARNGPKRGHVAESTKHEE